MKIVHASISHRPDDDRILFREALSLIKIYKQITIIGVSDDFEESYYEGIKLLAISAGGLLIMLNRIEKKIYKEKPVVLHIHEPQMLPLALKYKRLTGAKVIYDVHEDHPEIHRLFSKRNVVRREITARILQFMEYFYSKRVDGILVVTPDLKLKFEKRQKHLLEIRNYPRVDLVENFGDFAAYDDYLKFIQGHFVILYIGHISRTRRLELAMQTTVKLNKSGYSVKFVAVGPGDSEDIAYYSNLFNSGCSSRLYSEIPHPMVGRFIKKADLGWAVLPYHKNYMNSFPNKIFEYMQHGAAYISSELKYVKDITAESKSGIVVKELAVEELSKAVQQNIILNDNYKILGEKGKLAFKSKYNWETQESGLLEFYKYFERTH